MSWWGRLDPLSLVWRRMERLATPAPAPSDNEGTLPPEAELSDDERREALDREVSRREHDRVVASIEREEP